MSAGGNAETRRPGGSLGGGVVVSVVLGLAAFLVTYIVTPRPEVDSGGLSARMLDAWLVFTFVEVPVVLLVGLVLLCIRRTRRTGGGVLIGAGLSLVVTSGICNAAG